MKNRLCLSLAGVLLCSIALPARAQPPGEGLPVYGVRFIGEGTPVAVNDAGQVAGNHGGRAWFADVTGAPVDLPLPAGATSSVARDLNDPGWVVGVASGSGLGSRAVLWRPTGPASWSITLIPTPADADGDATAVNDQGDVAGWFVGGGSFAYTSAGDFIELFPLGFTAQPADINEQRVLIGRSFFGQGQSLDLDTLVVTDLGLPTGTGTNYMSVDLNGLNDAGDLCGRAAVATALPDDDQAVRYDAATGTWEALNSPVPQAFAIDLDAAGNTLFAVGFSSPVFVRFQGVGTFDLEDLFVEPDAAWSAGLATGGDISDNGTVVCTGGNAETAQSGVIVLTPQAQEGPWTDLGAALAGALGEPALTGTGTLQAGTPTSLVLDNALPAAPATFVLGVSELSAPFYGGTLVPSPDVIVPGLMVGAGGGLVLAGTWPSGVPSGLQLWHQIWISDAAGPFGWAASNALRSTSP